MAAGISRPIHTVGLFGKFGDVRFGQTMRDLCLFLTGRGLNIILEEATAQVVADSNLKTLSMAHIGAAVDLAIVIGGDGSLLNVARALAGAGVPLLGVNVGRLGFLADVSRDDMLTVIGRILDGDFAIEERFMLYAQIIQGQQVVHSSHAFNDVVVNKLGLARLIEFSTYVDDEFVNETRADGLIVATPTGSTAYAMSAGGPILHPTLPAIVLVPICPHTLSQRPIAVHSTATIEIVINGNQGAHVTFDGQANFPLHDNDRIRIRRAEAVVRLIHPSRRNHYEVLREKLHWGRP